MKFQKQWLRFDHNIRGSLSKTVLHYIASAILWRLILLPLNASLHAGFTNAATVQPIVSYERLVFYRERYSPEGPASAPRWQICILKLHRKMWYLKATFLIVLGGTSALSHKNTLLFGGEEHMGNISSPYQVCWNVWQPALCASPGRCGDTLSHSTILPVFYNHLLADQVACPLAHLSAILVRLDYCRYTNVGHKA